MQEQKLVIVKNTFLKAFPKQSAELKRENQPDGLVKVYAGTKLDIVSHLPYEGAPGAGDDHIFIELAQCPKGAKSERRWFVWGEHAQAEGTEPGNNPKQDEPVKQAPATTRSILTPGPRISIPGISKPVGIYEPIYYEPKVSNFTWAEFTKGGERIPVDASVTGRIVKVAKYLDNIRHYLGDLPIRITSGYRDPISNRRVGGASRSRHMSGDAVDFFVQGMDVIETFVRLKKIHHHGGLAVGNGFVHLDLRPGSPARWTYPGGPRVPLW